MAQQNFPLMVSVDWLSLSCMSENPIVAPSDVVPFVWYARKYGTKQFKNVWDVMYVDTDGVLEPFGVICSEPTLDSWDARSCSLKLDNHLLYRNNRGYWLDLLNVFLREYHISVETISRCDIAGDFLYLRNRLSGPGLVRKLKSYEYWKCGSVKVSEHYTMPYSIEWQKRFDPEGFKVDTFLQQGTFDARVETMTFGTMSSDAQVCLYDKTLELNRSAVRIKQGDKEIVESAKEYIRDCHKAAGVFDKSRHTWRLEIRLRNKALFIFDPAIAAERPLYLDDLTMAKLPMTFMAAADRYFRLVDATNGGTAQITPSYISSMGSHKNRLPIVSLFGDSKPSIKFSTKKYHEPANKYHRSVINRLDQLGDRLERCPVKYTKEDDKKALPALIERLMPIADRLKDDQQRVKRAMVALKDLHDIMSSNPDITTDDDRKALIDAKEVLERHFNTESPTFTRNIISTLSNYSNRMQSMLESSTDVPLRRARSAFPSDSQVLLDAANILKGVFVDVCHDERRKSLSSIYATKFREAINIFNNSDSPDGWLLDALYTFTMSVHYIERSTLIEILTEYQETDFWHFYRCRFDLFTFLILVHRANDTISWTPPLLPVGTVRQNLPYLDVNP